MVSIAAMVASAALLAGTSQPAPVRVTGIRAVHRHGQTFVTWRDAAEGEAGARFRYSLYRSDKPITQANLPEAELCYPGVLNNSAKLFGYAFNAKDRLNPAKPTCVIEEGGQPLPMWSGLAVRTVTRDGASYYAVVATDAAHQALSQVEPGESATREAVEEKVAPIQPIKIGDSKARNPSSAISGVKGLPLLLNLHGSSSTGGDAGSVGDLYLYFATAAMGWRDGLPGLFAVYERPGKDKSLILFTRDCIESPAGDRPIETCWFGYFCVPVGAKHAEPRAYAFTERRLDWMLEWVIAKYEADRNRICSAGQSMGGMGSTQWAYRHPEVFAAVFPRLGRVRQSWLPAALPTTTSINKGRWNKPAPMEDGVTDYFDRMDSVKWVSEHHEDLPFYAFGCGRNDWVEPWKSQVEMVNALTANHHGFAMAWSNGGHDNETASKTSQRIARYYTAAMFARNRSYPAFGNSSINDDMGSGDLDENKKLKDGDPEGGINMGFIWGDVVDERGKWSVSLSNDLAKAEMTVDVTPRRCQAFKPKPGEKMAWTNSLGDSGVVTTDEWGLVTVPKVRIQPGGASVLTLSRQVAAGEGARP